MNIRKNFWESCIAAGKQNAGSASKKPLPLKRKILERLLSSEQVVSPRYFSCRQLLWLIKYFALVPASGNVPWSPTQCAYIVPYFPSGQPILS
jgi:hypothetical protein